MNAILKIEYVSSKMAEIAGNYKTLLNLETVVKSQKDVYKTKVEKDIEGR